MIQKQENIVGVVARINDQIDKLTCAIAALDLAKRAIEGQVETVADASAPLAAAVATRRGRPAGSKNKRRVKAKPVVAPPIKPARTVRRLSKGGRERIAAAQKARWAAKRKKTATGSGALVAR